MKYRNIGAPFGRAGGGVWARDQVAEATPEELLRKAYKLRPVLPPRVGIPTMPPSTGEPPEVEAPDDWPLQMSPELYLELHPSGPNAALAHILVDKEKEADGKAD